MSDNNYFPELAHSATHEPQELFAKKHGLNSLKVIMSMVTKAPKIVLLSSVLLSIIGEHRQRIFFEQYHSNADNK